MIVQGGKAHLIGGGSDISPKVVGESLFWVIRGVAVVIGVGSLHHAAQAVPLEGSSEAPGIRGGQQQAMAVVSERLHRVVPCIRVLIRQKLLYQVTRAVVHPGGGRSG